ncbi:hypothetical protein MTR67_039805 [Solanum verrucosum]|uniref:Integrase zinc-binding domain-containing protein n=1 Tax=Solanum verrucosum TaxID=315347 RepID=A0AAF0UHI8_SOLVR|nr:hypothetical protein MTR67_039805 [Solanum verrucosum]
MSVLYQPSRANVVADALSRLSIGSVAHLEEDEIDLAIVIAHNGSDSSFMSEVKAKQGLGPILVELMEAVLKESIETFFQGRDGVLRYQGRFCVPNVDDLRDQILSEAHSSQYSIHPESTKMYHDLREVYWWDGMKKHIVEYVAKCPNCQQVKAQHQK